MTDISATTLAKFPEGGPMDERIRRTGREAVDLVGAALPWTQPRTGTAGPRDPEPDHGEDADGQPLSGEEFVQPSTFEEDPVATAVARDGAMSVTLELPEKPMATAEAGAYRWKASTVHIPADAIVMIVDEKPNRRAVRFPTGTPGIAIAASDAEAQNTDTRILLTNPMPLPTTGEIWATNTTGAPIDLSVIELFEH